MRMRKVRIGAKFIKDFTFESQINATIASDALSSKAILMPNRKLYLNKEKPCELIKANLTLNPPPKRILFYAAP